MCNKSIYFELEAPNNMAFNSYSYSLLKDSVAISVYFNVKMLPVGQTTENLSALRADRRESVFFEMC